MRVLFISHDVGDYGAGRSLRLLLENIKDWEIDLATYTPIKAVAEKNFGNIVRRIYGVDLPINHCWVNYHPEICKRFEWSKDFGAPRYNSNLKIIFRNIKEKIFRPAIYKIIKKNHYDFIHINSLLLHQVVRKEFPFLIHIREIYDNSNYEAINSINQTKGAVFIDEATFLPFKDLLKIPKKIIINPVDMRNLADVSESNFLNLDLENRNHVIFSIIGAIVEEKGVDFIIKAFSQIENPFIRLVIAGDDSHKYAQRVKNATIDKRVIFTGHLKETYSLYKISDYVIRGESIQCIGRTMIEALFAGCDVIVPGEKKFVEFADNESMSSRIHLYKPRDPSSFVNTLNMCAIRKKKNIPEYFTNTKECAQSFKEFAFSIFK
jgi:glycosyltransferase involved in cell wall biosynthesis